MITVHDPSNRNYTGIGRGVLEPTEAVCEEKAGGMFELTINQPINSSGRDRLITDFCILQAPVPVRDAPKVDAISTQTEKKIYQVKFYTYIYRVYRRASDNLPIVDMDNGNNIRSVNYGLEVIELPFEYSDAPSGANIYNFTRVMTTDTGEEGYIRTSTMTYVRTDWMTVDDSDRDAYIKDPPQTRNQLFRVYRTERSSADRTLKAYAKHITYDLDGYVVSGADFTDVPAQNAINTLLLACDRQVTDFKIYCTCTGNITADYSGKSLLHALLNTTDGIAVQCGARVIRDNYNLYILEDIERRRNAEIRYGKNLTKAVLDTDYTDFCTRIIPKSKDDIFADPVDREDADDYPVIIARQVEYNMELGEGTHRIPADTLREKLREAAAQDFADGLYDPEVTLDAEFVRVELARGFTGIANEYSVHMYDTIPVIDPEAGIEATVRMVGYTYDCLLDKYTATNLSTDINGRLEY